jgi:hypothetical protein
VRWTEFKYAVGSLDHSDNNQTNFEGYGFCCFSLRLYGIMNNGMEFRLGRLHSPVEHSGHQYHVGVSRTRTDGVDREIQRHLQLVDSVTLLDLKHSRFVTGRNWNIYHFQIIYIRIPLWCV